jgi:hypothetical protein
LRTKSFAPNTSRSKQNKIQQAAPRWTFSFQTH